MTLKKLVLASAALGALCVAGSSASASDPITTPAPASQEGCVSPAGDTCTYTSTRTGGFVARGSAWTVVVSIPTAAPSVPCPPNTSDPRDTNCDGKLTYTFDASSTPAMPQGCSLWGPGTTVTVTAGAGSAVAAGNPFLAVTDGSVNNECAGGRLPDRTDVAPQ
jgi:hypothetical protein